MENTINIVRKGHIKKEERHEISILLQRGYSCRDIGKTLGRHHTTISREIRKNKVNGVYQPEKANHKAYVRRKYSKYQGMRVHQRPELIEYIQEKLELGWNPETIAGRLKTEDTHIPYVSAPSIYKYLYSSFGQALSGYLPSKQHRKKKRRKKKTKREMIPNRIGIEYRPVEANERLEYGHYEADTIVSGKKHKSKVALSVVFGRKSKYAKLKKIPNLRPKTNNKAIEKMMSQIEKTTLTQDNGIENKAHQMLSKKLNIDIFFCDPYSSWQKGGVEHLNKMIRRFIPKGSNIADFSDAYIQKIEDYLNNIPRKSLNFKTPHEVMVENNLFLNKIQPRVVRLRV